MTIEKMRELLESDEKITIEYKESREGLNNSIFETVASFSNRYGGYIILGVKDGGIPLGINRNVVKDIKRNFVNQLNNSNKMSPTIYISLEEIEYEGKLLLWAFVPPTSTVQKCSGRIFDRNEDGDMDITDSAIQVENMYKRKSDMYAEHKLFPYLKEEHLRMDLMHLVRQLVANKNQNHSWLKMSNKELMVSAGLYETNFTTGEEGFNLAAVLLFGRDEVIKSCAPGYVTDAIYRVENMDRYDDRLIVSLNLIESYDKLMEFIAKHTSDKFHLIDNVSVSLRDLIAREIVSNILVHRDYTSAFPAKLIIEKNWIHTENWCKPRKHGRLLAEEFTPYPKNPLLTDFFVAIGRADTLGSGVRNLYKYTPIYSSGGNPELFEDDVFKINIPLNSDAAQELKKLTELTNKEQQIYDLIKGNPKISIDDIAADYDVTRRTILREIQEIKKKVYLEYDKKEAKWNV